jgi:predicted pyridoxine 5'-phosphate oxidase superfamily flavin-nucleotide-binding protein
MAYSFLDIAATPAVKAAQAAMGSDRLWAGAGQDRQFDRFTPDEIAFIAQRDSFYMATVSETGWPYVQFRGGPAGFLKVVDETTLAFADFRGNRQYVSVGNAAKDDRASMIVVDYANRRRLKLLGRLRFVDLAGADAALAAVADLPGYPARVERIAVFEVEAFDWNCPQHITPRS